VRKGHQIYCRFCQGRDGHLHWSSTRRGPCTALCAAFAPLQPRTDSEVILPAAMVGGNTGLVLCQVQRPMIGPMTPGIDLAKRIE
jgi:hypothetical protein